MGIPVTRGECGSVPRPCPYASCRYNISGAKGCALDFADSVSERRPHAVATHLEIAQALGISDESVRLIEKRALTKLAIYCSAEAA